MARPARDAITAANGVDEGDSMRICLLKEKLPQSPEDGGPNLHHLARVTVRQQSISGESFRLDKRCLGNRYLVMPHPATQELKAWRQASVHQSTTAGTATGTV